MGEVSQKAPLGLTEGASHTARRPCFETPCCPSLVGQVQARQLVQVGIPHGLQLVLETRVQLPDARLIPVACRARRVVAADLPGDEQARRRAETPLGAVGFYA